ncbi:iron-sulfur cluster biosynthesis family protein [Pediococcus claussenii]|uniref:Core domain-containing protein n=1 Tax=Pediococcus claussenii (strain ATCC BAA-344 / DSM 14800 / JCM 18046 / KCTC 3811 / LMG 21948 / P06) TaxID=701521 RepID=G8PBJ9_PEDCP|nr:iron-sulfur cluster biosynthesis family protein [Pediococcus claussenii]AEV94748.1 hypothetical protein PECL_445 [Pediococcus claussenii ATCC BAA-344]ANZ69944.1 hypothetical protein AYR57_06295 [Pediococcus claussenii]ANZ71760.1 hypothetical protein AYR58_06295 [Pediococcus claussenii]
MDIKFDETAINRVKPHLGNNKRLLLTFEDGVGAYSQHAMIHMQVQFSINIISNDMAIDEYDTTLTSNLGDVLIKGYSKEDLDDGLVISYNDKLNTLTLTGNGGVIDSNLGFIDFTDPNGVKENPAR